MSYLCTRLRQVRAFSSAGLEHLPYKQRVGGSNPSTPTTEPASPQDGRLFFVSLHFVSYWLNARVRFLRGSVENQWGL